MAKLTLLDMVQNILTSMDSDDVNSISETEEALQIVEIIEDTYFQLISERDWPHLKETCQLESVGDTDRPTTLKIPDLVSSIVQFKYETTESTDTNRKFKDVQYLHPEDFVDKVLNRNSSNSEVQEITTPNGTPIFVYNDRSPTFWTSFDDEFIVADAYNSTEETTLQGTNSVLICYRTPAFSQTDTFTPDLPEKMFPLLLSECRRASHLFFKQQDSIVDARRSLKGYNRMRDKDWRAHETKKVVNFGRK